MQMSGPVLEKEAVYVGSLRITPGRSRISESRKDTPEGIPALFRVRDYEIRHDDHWRVTLGFYEFENGERSVEANYIFRTPDGLEKLVDTHPVRVVEPPAWAPFWVAPIDQGPMMP